MKKRLILSFSIFFIFLGCSNKNILIITDPWWEDSYGIEKQINQILALQFVKTGKTINKVTAETEDEVINYINETAKSSQNPIIILTPIFFSFLDKNPNLEKKINYIIINGYYDSSADNKIAVYSFREEVYFKAGIKAAQFSKENNNCTISAVFYTGSTSRKLEKNSFIEGYETLLNCGKLAIFEQQTYNENEKLKSFINSGSKNNTGLFFFSGSSLNLFCLDIAKPLSIAVSGENLNSLGLYNELIEFSVDDDMIEMVNTAIKMGLDGEIKNDIPVNALLREKGIHF